MSTNILKYLYKTKAYGFFNIFTPLNNKEIL